MVKFLPSLYFSFGNLTSIELFFSIKLFVDSRDPSNLLDYILVAFLLISDNYQLLNGGTFISAILVFCFLSNPFCLFPSLVYGTYKF